MAAPWLPCCRSLARASTRRLAALLLLLAALLPRRVSPLPPGPPAVSPWLATPDAVCFWARSCRSTALLQTSPTRCGPGLPSTAVASRLERVPHQRAGHSPNPAGCALSLWPLTHKAAALTHKQPSRRTGCELGGVLQHQPRRWKRPERVLLRHWSSCRIRIHLGANNRGGRFSAAADGGSA